MTTTYYVLTNVGENTYSSNLISCDTLANLHNFFNQD